MDKILAKNYLNRTTISTYLDLCGQGKSTDFFSIHRLNKYISIQAVIGIEQEMILKQDRKDSLRKC